MELTSENVSILIQILTTIVIVVGGYYKVSYDNRQLRSDLEHLKVLIEQRFKAYDDKNEETRQFLEYQISETKHAKK